MFPGRGELIRPANDARRTDASRTNSGALMRHPLMGDAPALGWHASVALMRHARARTAPALGW